MKDIYIGSEGTLGIITAATLKLFSLPRSKATALVALADIQSSIKLIELINQHSNTDLTAFEIMSSSALTLVSNGIEKLSGLINDHSPWIVLIELSSMEDEQKSYAQLEALLEKAFDIGLINDAVLSKSLQQSKDLWRIREGIPEAQFILGTIVKHDISLPISELAKFVASTEVKLRKFWPHLQTVIFGHIGDGNLHYNIAPIAPELSKDLEIRRKDINQLVHDEVYKYSGSFSAEHGIGQLKRDELTTRKNSIELELMRSIKRALDPHGIMNPGKVL